MSSKPRPASGPPRTGFCGMKCSKNPFVRSLNSSGCSAGSNTSFAVHACLTALSRRSVLTGNRPRPSAMFGILLITSDLC